MKTTAKIMASTLFIILMVGGAYAWDTASSGGNPPIWQIFRKGQAVSVYWVTWQGNPRFAIYRSGTPDDPSDDIVWDKETGLVWERSPSTKEFTWFMGLEHCRQELKLGDRMGWRLPAIQELSSLTDPTQLNPSLPTGHPFINVQFSDYWSATTSAFDPNEALIKSFASSDVVDLDKTETNNVWCVRGGHGVDLH